MGKAKKGRAHSKANRQDPLGSSNKGKDKPEADTPQAHYLLNELKSSEVPRKESAVVALAQLLSQGDASQGGILAEGPYRKLVTRLLEGGIIKLLIERMFDTASTVRLHAAGTLRNMASIGDAGISQKMMQDDVMTALLGLLDKAGEEQGEELAVQGLETMTSLFESCDEGVSVFSRRSPASLESVFRVLMLAAGDATQHEDLLTSAAQTVHTVTDHNLVIVEQICRHPEALPFLASLVDPDRLPPLPPVPRLHIAGALSNVYQELQRAASSGAKLPLPSLPEPEPLLSSVLKVLCPFLTFADAAQAMAPTITAMAAMESASAANAAHPEDDEEDEGEGRMDTGDDDKAAGAQGEGAQLSKKEARHARKVAREAQEAAEQEFKRVKEEWLASLRPRGLALEVLANLCNGDDDDDEELAWGSDEDEEIMEAMARDQAHAPQAASGPQSDAMLQNMLRSSGLLTALVTTLKELCACLLSSGLDLNTVPIDMIRAVLDLRQRGAVALGNIVADYPTAQLTAEGGSLWAEFRAMCRAGLDEETATTRPWYRRGEEPWLGVLTGVMASFVQRAPQAADREDLSMLAMLLSSSTYYEVRVNAAAMLGLAGALPDVVEDVAKALSASLTNESHVMVEAEVLNAVMDIFSDDALHPLFTQLGLLKPLKQLLPQFRTKCKSEAVRHGKEALAHAREVALNIQRFIKYKEKAK